MTPEARARIKIDAMLEAAGWIMQHRGELNLHAGPDVAVREVPTPTVEQVVASLPHEQQEQIEARFDQLRQEVDSLRELRQIAGEAEGDMATALSIKQPSVSKIEKQADMYLSTSRGYVEAIGGKLELTVKLPERAPVRIEHLDDLMRPTTNAPSRRAGNRGGIA